MDFRFTEEQLELREIAQAFLTDQAGSETVRSAMESELGYDPGLWKQLGAELGWTSVIIPEEYGGLGLGFVELIALLEVCGQHVLCAPFFSSVCLGANALLVAGSEDQKKTYLPGIAMGETRATLAFVDKVDTRAAPDGADFVLDGTKRYVLDGHCADLLIVSAGDELFAVPADSAGVHRTLLPTMDQTRRLAEIRLDGVRVQASARLPGGDRLDKILQRACAALAAEQVGGAQKCLDMAVAYAKEREQFGRPIGSFQSIKHKCADMFVKVEAARSAAYYAGCVAAEDGDELAATSSLAKSYCSDAFFHCAAESLQIHGGVGFTWEYDVHLYFKRAKSSEVFLGSPAEHRELVAREIGL